MAWKNICKLKYAEAVESIENADKVYFKEGIWNQYKLVDREDAEYFIKNSEIGADVNVDEESGMYYVSCPYQSDMW